MTISRGSTRFVQLSVLLVAASGSAGDALDFVTVLRAHYMRGSSSEFETHSEVTEVNGLDHGCCVSLGASKQSCEQTSCVKGLVH